MKSQFAALYSLNFLVSACTIFLVGVACLTSASPAEPQLKENLLPRETDFSRKAQILNSVEWRRAVFELGHWLDTQQIYTANEVAVIKKNFNARVAGMSSYDLTYLLEDLEDKFRIMDSPEARDARAWVGQYMSLLSDSRKAALLEDIPDITRMNASELSAQIEKINATRLALQQQQSAAVESREQILSARQQTIAATQKAVMSSYSNSGSYSPYRGSFGGKQAPFSDIRTGGSVHASVGPFGAYVSF